MSWDVFLSYSSRDIEAAEALRDALQNAGISCWFAPVDIQGGADYAERIHAAIPDCRSLVLILSTASDQSPHVRRELDIASDYRLPVFPFLIENFKPRPEIDYFLRGVQWIEAYQPPHQAYFAELLQVIQERLNGLDSLVELDLPKSFNPQKRPHFIDRGVHQEKLWRALQTCIERRSPQVAWVMGEAGEGKSVLVGQFILRAREQYPQICVAHTECTGINEGEISVRHLFLELLAEAVRSQAVTGNPIKFVNENLPAWMVVVKPNLEGRSEYARSSSESRRAQFCALARHAAEAHPLILFIEDIHWAGEDIIELLYPLCVQAANCPLLIICTFRQSGMNQHPQADVFKSRKLLLKSSIEIDLEKSGIDVAEYVSQRFAHNRIAPKLLERVQRSTDGNPLWVVLLFDAWIEDGILIESVEAGGQALWEMPGSGEDGSRIEIPDKMKDVLEQRLRGMPENLYKILKMASVEGEDFTAQILAHLLQADELAMLDELEMVKQRYRLIFDISGESSEDPFDHYRFWHNFIYRYLYDSLKKGERRIYHRMVGEALESLYPAQGVVARHLAVHFSEAQQYSKSVKYALQAARFAQDFYSFHEIIHWAQFALKELDRQNLTSDEELLQRSEAACLYEWALEDIGNPDLALPLLQDCLERLEGRPEPEMTHRCGEVLLSMTSLSYFQSAGAGDEYARRALAIFRELGDVEFEYKTISRLSDLLLDVLGKYAEGIELVQQMLAMCDQFKDYNRKADVLSDVGWALLYPGEYARALEMIQESHRVIEVYRVQDPETIAQNWRFFGCAYYEMGEYEQALEAQKKATAIYQKINDMILLTWTRWEMGKTLREMQRPQEAVEVFDEVIRYAESEDVADETTAVWGHVELAKTETGLGNYESAWEHLARSSQLLAQYDGPEDEVDLLLAYANFHLAKGVWVEAEKALVELDAKLADFDSRVPRIKAAELWGRLSEGKGDPGAAETWYLKGIQLAREMNARVPLALCLQSLGALHLKKGQPEKARGLLDEARFIRQELGHAWFVEQIDALLEGEQ